MLVVDFSKIWLDDIPVVYTKALFIMCAISYAAMVRLSSLKPSLTDSLNLSLSFRPIPSDQTQSHLCLLQRLLQWVLQLLKDKKDLRI